MQLDHLVINTRFATDLAAEQFSALGFQLTPRGYHSLGSINHLMMFGGHYLELIGLPIGGATLRQEVVDSVDGIDGLVLRTSDAEATRMRLIGRGVSMQAVQTFSRDVDIDGQRLAARFETVRLVPGQYAAGRIYYCHHLTPELVWRAPWLVHPNGVIGIAALSVVSDDPVATRRAFSTLDESCGADAEGDADDRQSAVPFALHFDTREQIAARFGTLADVLPRRASCFAAITFRVRDDAALRDLRARLETTTLSTAALRTETDIDSAGTLRRLMVALPAFDTLLEFTA